MTADLVSTPTDWLTLPELAQLTGETPGRVRRMFDEKQIIGSRRDGSFKVPKVFLVDGEPLGSLRGTIFVLLDAGFSEDEAIDWLLGHDDSLDLAPIDALRAGRKTEVRRVAAALA